MNNLDLRGNTTEFKTLPTHPRSHRYILMSLGNCRVARLGGRGFEVEVELKKSRSRLKSRGRGFEVEVEVKKSRSRLKSRGRGFEVEVK